MWALVVIWYGSPVPFRWPAPVKAAAGATVRGRGRRAEAEEEGGFFHDKYSVFGSVARLWAKVRQ